MIIIGMRLSLQWEGKNEWYDGTVIEVDPNNPRKFSFKYDEDGEEHEEDLDKIPDYRVIPGRRSRIKRASRRSNYTRPAIDERTIKTKNSSADLERQGAAEKSSDATAAWKCQGCGKINSSERKKCPPPCFKWKNGQRSKKNVPHDEEEVYDQSEDEEERKCHLSEALTPGNYEYVPLPTGGAKDVHKEELVFLFSTGWARGKIVDIDRASTSQKRTAKDFSVPRLVRYVSDSSRWLHDLGNPVIYLSEEQFNNLNTGGTDASEGVEAGAWCAVRRIDSQSKPSSRALYAIGQRMKKQFPGFGECEGVITLLPTGGHPWYRVRYLADDKEEDIHRDDISKYVTVAPGQTQE